MNRVAKFVGAIPYRLLRTPSGWYAEGFPPGERPIVAFDRDSRRGAIDDLVTRLQAKHLTGTLQLVAEVTQQALAA